MKVDILGSGGRRPNLTCKEPWSTAVKVPTVEWIAVWTPIAQRPRTEPSGRQIADSDALEAFCRYVTVLWRFGDDRSARGGEYSAEGARGNLIIRVSFCLAAMS